MTRHTSKPGQPTTKPQRIVVVGGGLAGIAAALAIARHKLPVTLVETRKKLGGRAGSFTDRATGLTLDNCQHVVMRCCTNLLDLYEKLHVDHHITWHRRLYFADQQGRIDELEADDLPAPLHMVRTMLAMKTLGTREKFAIARAMHAITRTNARKRYAMRNQTFAHWLGQHGQSDALIEKFWSLIVTSACNELPENLAAHHALQLFQEGFLGQATAYEMGVANVPLTELYHAAANILTQHGGQLMLGSSAEKFIYENDQLKYLRLADRQEIAGRTFISTVPFDRLDKLVTDPMRQRDPRLRHLDQLAVSPIIGIHLFLRSATPGPVMQLPHLALMNSPLHWIFNKGRIDPDTAARLPGQQATPPTAANPHARVEHLHGVISAAYDLLDHSPQQITQMVMRELHRALPDTRDAQLIHSRVIKEKRATFAARPGTQELRPAVQGPIDNLLLAGDWVDTGWPATMEGAVRSGYHAAAVALQQQGHTALDPRVPDLAPGALYRLLST